MLEKIKLKKTLFALFQKFVEFQNLFYIRLQRKYKSIENKDWNKIKFFFVVCFTSKDEKLQKREAQQNRQPNKPTLTKVE